MKEAKEITLHERKLRMLGEQVRSFRKRSRTSIKKRMKFTRMNESLIRENRIAKSTEKQYGRDEYEIQKQLFDSDELLATFRKTVFHKKDRFQHQHEALSELEGNIKERTNEVHRKIAKLEEAILEWQTANFIINDNCRIANYFAAERFHNWHQTIPLLQSWLWSEEKSHQCLYSSASFAGLYEELQAYYDIRQQIQDYADTQYKDITAVKLIPPLKQINEQRQVRSEAFDQLHLKVMKQLRSFVRQCDNIHAEIQDREQVRARLNSIAMELNGALEEDLAHSLVFCEEEARRTMDQLLEAFKKYSTEERKIISRTYVYLASTLNNSFFSNLNDEASDIYRAHHHNIVNQLEFYESESIVLANQPLFCEKVSPSQGLDQGSVVSDLSDSIYVDSKSIRDPATGISSTKVKKNYIHDEAGGIVHKDSNEVVAQFRESFDGIKRRLVASKTKKCVRAALPDILRSLDQIAPNLKNNWKTLQDLSVDFEIKEGSERIGSTAQNDRDKTQLENLLHSQCILKDIQHQCAAGAYDSICTVSNLLKRIKEKKELTRFLRSEDSFSQPLGYYKPHSSDPLYVHQEDSSEIERKEFMTAQQLISRVSDTIGSNKLLFEEWMIEGIGSRYEHHKNQLTKELTRLNLVDPKVIVQNEIEVFDPMETREQNALKNEELLQSFIADTMGSDFTQKDVVKAEVDETETSVQNLLSKSEQLLASMEKIKIAGVEDKVLQSVSPSLNVDGDLVPADVISTSHMRPGFRPFYTLSEDAYEQEESEAFEKVEESHRVGSSIFPAQSATGDRRKSVLQPDGNLHHVNSEGIIVAGFGEDHDKELAKVEILMKGDLFTMTLFWKAHLREVLLVMRHVFDRTGYKEYKMHLSIQMLADLTENHKDAMINFLFTESSKLCQQISHGLQIEVIDHSFYNEITGRLIVENVQIEGESDIDIKMYLPFRKDRRASVLQNQGHSGGLQSLQKRQSFASGFSQGTYIASKANDGSGLFQGPRRVLSPTVELPYSYLLKVLTLRTKTGILMRHSFPMLYSVENHSAQLPT